MSAKNNILYLSEQTRNEISEITALSGYGNNMVKEVFEYMLYNWAIKLSDNPDDYVTLEIPYLGNVVVKYKGDRVLPSGELTTEVESSVELSDSFKKLIGDIHDEGYVDLIPIMTKKIEQSIMVACNSVE